jgi:hypothetical protein
MAGNDFIFGYFFARRLAKPWKPGPRTHPKMPARPWRLAAGLSFSIGMLAAWLLFRDNDPGALVLRVLVGGLIGFVIGMYVVESVWERRRRERVAVETSPIGRRR